MVIVIGWQVYDIARHTMGLKAAAFRLGIIGLVQFIPLFLLTLVTGWTADRLDRRSIARAAVALELGCAVALGWLAWTHSTTLLASVRSRCAARSWTRICGPGAQRPRAQSRAARYPAARDRSVLHCLADRRGPRPGSRGLSLCLCSLRALRCERRFFLIAFVCLLAIGPVPRAAINRGPNQWAQMVEGLRYVRHNGSCLGRSAWIFLQCSWAARRRCCRYLLATFFIPVPRASAICAPRRQSARR